MNWPAIVVSLVIALVVSIFFRGDAFSFRLFFGTFTVFALVFHLKPSLLGKLNKPKEDGPTDNDSDK